MKRVVALAGLMLGLACSRAFQPRPLAPLPFPADTVRTEVVSDGVVHRYIYSPKGPWAINTLEVDLDRCNAVIAVKGVDSAAGRIKTTAILDSTSKHAQVLGGVNADFFSLQTGVPTNMLVMNGRMLTPANAQPILAFDSAGMPHIGRAPLGFHPKEAVGGRPILLRDSAIVGGLDSTGQASFVARNPRTAAGFSRNRTHVIFATIDGRQMPNSDGTSLRETAEIMRALGAVEAINLDGGGSTTLVYRSNGRLRIANRPSDKEGERAVGDALEIIRRCGAR